MKISEFVAQQKTTLDTVKYYMKLGLLTPKKEKHIYNFSPKEEQDFQNVLYLKSLGFSLELIKKIKSNHELNCSTTTQWQENLELIEAELFVLLDEKEKLQNKEKMLREVQEELIQKLTNSERQ